MNVLILGDGPEEESWAAFLDDAPGHRLLAACPGFKGRPELPGGPDLDAALATPGVEVVVVGGDDVLRAEGLRRAAGSGLPVVALHPPGENADPYYQVALSHSETGATVIPDLPARRHPAVAALRAAIDKSELGEFRALRYELPADRSSGDLVRGVFSRAVDAVRACLGEIETITAVGDPPGDRPTLSLVVQLRAVGGRRAEVRIGGDSPQAVLVLEGDGGSLAWEHDATWPGGPTRLVRRTPRDGAIATEIAPWDPHAAILAALDDARAGRADVHPDLLDGTRAMELAEAATRSLRKGRTIDLFYEEMSEEGNFKSVMTGLGCGLLLAVLVVLPVALAGPVFGFRWTIYLAWLLPPLLVLFLLVQLLKLGLPKRPPDDTGGSKVEEARTEAGSSP
jgi:myo-inositol 2-dehydrogenase/D-chiro-inositol 1-dehydrogenase